MNIKYLSLLLFFAAGCASAGTTNEAGGTPETVTKKERKTTKSSIDVEKYRTRLSDRFALHENNIPDAFMQETVQREEEQNLYEGFRIQIFSGVNVASADTVASQFRAWADTTISGYQPETYTFFKTPYYRVHIGDFHSRERAIEFSQLVKRKFRDAWVVYDRVNPWEVPADTAQFGLKEKEE